MERNKGAVWKPANASQYIEALCLLKLNNSSYEFIETYHDGFIYCFKGRHLDQLEFRHQMVFYYNSYSDRFYIFYYTGNFKNNVAKRLRSKKEFANFVLLEAKNRTAI